MNATRYRPAEPAATTPWSLPAIEVTVSAAPPRAVSTPPKRQAGLWPQTYATASRVPLAPRPGLMATIPEPVAASPASPAVALWLTGGSARRQLVPLSLLHHTPGDWVRTLTFRLPWCFTTVRATCPP